MIAYGVLIPDDVTLNETGLRLLEIKQRLRRANNAVINACDIEARYTPPQVVSRLVAERDAIYAELQAQYKVPA